MSVLATEARNSVNGNFLQMLIFRPGILFIIADADIESLKSLHTLHVFDKLVKSERSLNYTKFWAFCFWQKMVIHFWQSVDGILENVSVTETIV